MVIKTLFKGVRLISTGTAAIGSLPLGKEIRLDYDSNKDKWGFRSSVGSLRGIIRGKENSC